VTDCETLAQGGQVPRARIIRATTELISERGVAATSLEGVSARAGTPHGQLAEEFTSRDDLLRAVARTTSDEVVGGHADLSAALDTIEGWRSWVSTLVSSQQTREADQRCPLGILAGQLAEDDNARRELADGLDHWEAVMHAALDRLTARGKLDSQADPGLLAQRTIATLLGGLLLTEIRRDPDQLEMALNGALDAIVGALATL
jgi:TetR/AcrR family transcriptional repressor of nem operon